MHSASGEKARPQEQEAMSEWLHGLKTGKRALTAKGHKETSGGDGNGLYLLTVAGITQLYAFIKIHLTTFIFYSM